MAILKLKPTCKDYIWGGDKLRKYFKKESDHERIAETWELSCHPDGLSYIAEGEYQGLSLAEYIKKNGKDVLGSNCSNFKDFPVLIKLIDAKDNLSIQVHPDDAYALKNEGQYGKTEMWYIVDCEEGASLYYGFNKEVTKEEFEQRIEQNTLLEVLNEVKVNKGDVFFIEAGTIHAIGKDIVIAEIQQNSNVTYRVFDYNRTDDNGNKRDLHVKQAVAVANRKPVERKREFGTHLSCCKYFCVDQLVLDGKRMAKMVGEVTSDTFLHILVLEGSGVIGQGKEIQVEKGDSIFITAGSGEFYITGECTALLTTVPNNQ